MAESETKYRRRRQEIHPGVVCEICGKKCDFLPSHLRLQHQKSAHEYRLDFGLGKSTPLHSETYSEMMKGLLKPASIEQIRNASRTWIRSIHPAMSDGRLPFRRMFLPICIPNGVGETRIVTLKPPAKLILEEDLSQFIAERNSA